MQQVLGGSYLVEHILKKNLNIKLFGFYRSNSYLKLLKKAHKNKIKFTKVDLANFNHVKKSLLKIKPDLIFHLASNADVRGSFDNPLEHVKNNNIVTANLLEALRELNLKPLIIISSTSEVYGIVKKNKMPITEKQEIAPINPYAVTKTFQDLLSQVYSKTYKFNIIITRMFSYINARRDNLFPTAFAKQIVKCEKYNKKYIFHGNLKSTRTFIDIEDAMEAYWLCATKGRMGEIYNICGDKIISVETFLKQLLKLSKKKIIPKLDKKLLRPQDIDLQIADCIKFKKDTGWKPKISFNDSVKKLLNHCRQHP